VGRLTARHRGQTYSSNARNRSRASASTVVRPFCRARVFALASQARARGTSRWTAALRRRGFELPERAAGVSGEHLPTATQFGILIDVDDFVACQVTCASGRAKPGCSTP
jgi:hypothetical protein